MQFLPLLIILFNFASFHEIEKVIVHGWRRIEVTNSSNNGFAVDDGFAINNRSMLLGTLSDGHIYEYDYVSNRLYDRFKIHAVEENTNCANSMIFTEVDDRQYLFAATSFSRDRLPIIYVFDYDGTSMDNRPDLYVNSINVRVGDYIPENVHVFYSPVRYKNHIYWGCYNDAGDPRAKIVRLDITSIDNLKFEIIRFNEKAHKTIALERINDILFVATEDGTIIRFDLKNSRQMASIVIPGTRELPQLERDQNNNLWLMDAEKHNVIVVTNPTEQLSHIEISRKSANQLSRLYSSTDGWVYGQGFRCRYDDVSKNIDMQKIENTRSDDFGIFFGGFQIQKGGDTHTHLGGYNRRYKDKDIKKLSLRFADITKNSTHPVIENRILNDFEMPVVGQRLQSIGTDGTRIIYVSCYWLGYNYEITPQSDTPLTNDQKRILTDHSGRVPFQYDIIRSYNGGGTGGVLFGRYTGNYSSAFLDYRKKDNEWIHVQLPNAQDDPLQYYSRITAIAEDEEGNIYMGTGYQTINVNTPEAAVFALDQHDLLNNHTIGTNKKIPFSWKDPSAEGEFPRPIKIMSLLASGDFLYGVGFNVQYNSSGKKRNRTSFFRIDLNTNTTEICTTLTSTMSQFANKILLKDENILILGFESKIVKYDLNNFDINSPLLAGEFTTRPITALHATSKSYFACTPGKILILDKSLILKSEIPVPPMLEGDEFMDTDILNGHLYAISKSGLLYRYALDRF